MMSHFCHMRVICIATLAQHFNNVASRTDKKKRTVRCVFKSCFTFPVVCLSP